MLDVIDSEITRTFRMTDDELLGAYEEGRLEARRLEAKNTALLAEIDRRRAYRPCGYLSTSAFVAHRTGETEQKAAGEVRIARALGEMPFTNAAYADGEIDRSRVWRLVRARETAPNQFATAEPMLVEKARNLDAKRFTIAVEMWRRGTAPQLAAEEEQERFARRRLSIRDRFDGMVELEALFDAVSGETVRAAIESLASPANRRASDGRTPTQTRADVLAEICRSHLDSGNAPTSGGRKPHLNVLVDLDTLHGPQRRSEIGHGRLIGPAGIEFLACDSTVCRLVSNGPGHILDMGRTVRTATPAQLKVLGIRDGGCVIPGCGRPPEWCDAHHLIAWVENGLTNVDEMCLLCRPHHMGVHLGTIDLPSLPFGPSTERVPIAAGRAEGGEPRGVRARVGARRLPSDDP